MESNSQLFPNRSSSLGWTGILDSDDLDEIDHATVIILFILRACQAFYLHCDSRVRFMLVCEFSDQSYEARILKNKRPGSGTCRTIMSASTGRQTELENMVVLF